MKFLEIKRLLDSDPWATRVIAAPIPARIAYSAPSGEPRVVPVSYVWDGEHFVFATWPTAPKLAAFEADPSVAMSIDSNDFPPIILLVRGRVVAMDHVDGIPDVYVEASRRIVGEEKMPAWEDEVRKTIPEMVVVKIRPSWIKIIDFETRFPGRPNPAGT